MDPGERGIIDRLTEGKRSASASLGDGKALPGHADGSSARIGAAVFGHPKIDHSIAASAPTMSAEEVQDYFERSASVCAQFRTTEMCGGEGGLNIRNRDPSGDTS